MKAALTKAARVLAPVALPLAVAGVRRLARRWELEDAEDLLCRAIIFVGLVWTEIEADQLEAVR